MGRPALDNSKDFMLRVRLNEEELKKLDKCCEECGKDRSNFVRGMIEDEFLKIESK